MGKPLYQLMIAFRIIVRTVGQFLVHFLQFFLHLKNMLKGHLGLSHYRTRIAQYHDLRQITDGNASLYGYHSLCRLLQSGQDFQHSRFSGTVLSYQCNTVFFVDNKRYIFKQRSSSELHFQSFY